MPNDAKVTEQNLTTKSHSDGKFAIEFTSSLGGKAIPGQVTFNLANQFYQESIIELNAKNGWKIDMGDYVLDNYETEKVQSAYARIVD